MNDKNFLSDELREALIDFSKAYNFFSPGDCITAISVWIESKDIEALYQYLKPSAEDENWHLTYSSLAKMDLNDVLLLYENAKKKVDLLKKKDELFKKIIEIRQNIQESHD